MKKLIGTVLLSVMLLSGCSYFSWMNPWHNDGEEKVYVAPKANPFIWQAALDKVSFMPLANTDIAGGVIVTEWYNLKGQPNEKFKLEIKVLSNELRSDCLQVVGFKKELVNGKWEDSQMSKSMLQAIELSILEKARVLYQHSLEK